jgi:hypothetical protein
MTPELEKVSEALENVQLGLLSCWLTSRKGYGEEALSWLLLSLSDAMLKLIDESRQRRTYDEQQDEEDETPSPEKKP